MSFNKIKNVDIVWVNVCKNEGEVFKTITGIEYKYVVYHDYILINNDKRRKITKESLESAIMIANPTPSKIDGNGIWGSSYVWGIITDKRIIL